MYCMRKSGTADLPLHNGTVPKWLASRMARIASSITQLIIEEFGHDEFLRRLSDPFWFQSFGAVMGMDWHSSGITTSTIGALKRGLSPVMDKLGLYVCGGRGKYSRRTPYELMEISSKCGLDGDSLVKASRLSAKVDNVCIQDGFNIYLHSFILTYQGNWAVVQQGMNPGAGAARRYHWQSSSLKSFVDDPHSAVVGKNTGEIINLSDSRTGKAKKSIIDFINEKPSVQFNELRKLKMPFHHDIREKDFNTNRLASFLALAYEKDFKDFTDTLLMEGLGPRTMQALAMVSEVVYGNSSRFSDPARFAFAHGGKDGHPFPVLTKVYDENISFLKRLLEKSSVQRSEKIEGFKKLSKLSWYIEKNHKPEMNYNKYVNYEKRNAHLYGGRTVKGWSSELAGKNESGQLDLFN